MKLEKWALLAEITSGAAIVISLVILIVEVHGNTTAVQAQTISAHVDGERRRREWLILNEGGITDLVFKSRNGQALSEQEHWRLDRYYADVLDAAAWQVGEVQAGRLPEELLSVATWRGMWGDQPRFRAMYQEYGAAKSATFVDYWETAIIGQSDR